jgi:hypothetical protein
MTPKQVRRERKKLEIKRDAIDISIEALQTTCTHPNVSKVYTGNSGNYDPSADSYWVMCTCPDCGKAWWEDQ